MTQITAMYLHGTIYIFIIFGALGTPKLWPLFTGGHCSEVLLCYKQGKWDNKILVAVGRCYVVVNSGREKSSNVRHFLL